MSDPHLDTWPSDMRALRLVPRLVELQNIDGGPFWLLGVELWSHMIVLRFGGISRSVFDREKRLHGPVRWFSLGDDVGTVFEPKGGGFGGNNLGTVPCFTGQAEFVPGVPRHATQLVVTFSGEFLIDAEPVTIIL